MKNHSELDLLVIDTLTALSLTGLSPAECVLCVAKLIEKAVKDLQAHEPAMSGETLPPSKVN